MKSLKYILKEDLVLWRQFMLVLQCVNDGDKLDFCRRRDVSKMVYCHWENKKSYVMGDSKNKSYLTAMSL